MTVPSPQTITLAALPDGRLLVTVDHPWNDIERFTTSVAIPDVAGTNPMSNGLIRCALQETVRRLESQIQRLGELMQRPADPVDRKPGS